MEARSTSTEATDTSTNTADEGPKRGFLEARGLRKTEKTEFKSVFDEELEF
jgi:hypothetical protein